MKKLELKDNIITDLPKNEVYHRIMDYFNRNRIKIKEMNKKLIYGMYGSRFRVHTKGIRAEPTILPVKIIINIEDREGNTELKIHLKKGYIGIASLGINKKYLMILARLMNNLKLQFYREMYLKDETSKCKNCGKVILYENQRFCEICGYELIENKNKIESLS